MNLRLAAGLAALTATALAVPATAAAKPVCLQITDASGDSSFAGSSHDALDIVSADLATGKRNLVAVLRLKSLTADPVLATGTTYTFDFTIGGVPHTLTYQQYAMGETNSTLAYGSGLNATTEKVDAVLDPSTATLTWTASRRAVPSLKKTGAKITGLGVESSFALNLTWPGGTYAASTPVDDASTGKSYTDLTPTCLKGT